MNKIIPPIAVAAALASVSTFALEYTDFDIIQDGATGPNDTYEGAFNLNLSPGENDSANISGYGENQGNGYFSDTIGGFPIPSDVTSAEISFWFSTVAGEIQVKISDSVITDLLTYINIAAPGSHFQSSLLLPDDTDLLLSIGATGELTYIIESSANSSFTLNYAQLKVTTAAVPDAGGSAILVGFGMLGLASFRRLRK